MAQSKSYKVTAAEGVIGFNNRKYAKGDVVTSEPEAHVKAWLRFGQVEEVKETAKSSKAAKDAAGKKSTEDTKPTGEETANA